MNAPACPRCGAPAVWKPEANGWGCDHCRQMLPPPGQPVAAPAPVAQAVPACPRCGGPAVWHAQAGRWGCDRCRNFLDQLGPAGPVVDRVKLEKRARATRMLVIGLVLFFLGLIITVATRQAAEDAGGGTYIIAYGPMVVGGVRFFQGLFGLMS